MASRKTVINRFINRKKAIKIILYGSLARKLLMRFEAKRINDKRKLRIFEEQLKELKNDYLKKNGYEITKLEQDIEYNDEMIEINIDLFDLVINSP